ncbi:MULTISPECIES: phage late control D family protein [unclassified Maridesulfovibrio]|uniref:phage late control D family protein n=1 Tax=unclassified Maridesulfovibrio TaxID=2794999 RepID=UPI003B3D710C
MNMKPRSAKLNLLYEGTDISTEIRPYVTGFTFNDNSGGKADDLSVSLEDRDQLWKSGWYPDKGAKLSASIVCTNWFESGGADLVLPCGKFEIDEIEMSAGAGDTVTLKAVSALVKNSIRKEKKTRAWENVQLSTIASDIAAEHSLIIQFSGNDATYNRIDQREESDLKFLDRIAEDEGNSLKIVDGRIVIYSGVDYDRNPASFTLSRGQSNIGRISLRDKVADVYSSCIVKYHDPKDKQLKTYTFTPPDAPVTGEVLQINGAVESIAEAERRARAKLRAKNKMERSGSISMMGDPRRMATMVFGLSGFHRFDGRYFIDTATHAYTRSAGYTTNLAVRGVLGY